MRSHSQQQRSQRQEIKRRARPRRGGLRNRSESSSSRSHSDKIARKNKVYKDGRTGGRAPGDDRATETMTNSPIGTRGRPVVRVPKYGRYFGLNSDRIFPIYGAVNRGDESRVGGARHRGRGAAGVPLLARAPLLVPRPTRQSDREAPRRAQRSTSPPRLDAFTFHGKQTQGNRLCLQSRAWRGGAARQRHATAAD